MIEPACHHSTARSHRGGARAGGALNIPLRLFAGGTLAPLAVAAFIVAGCGGASKPTSVTTADLNRNGAFWLSLTGDLRQTLVEDCQERLAQERPEGASGIRATPPNRLIQQMNLQYENAAKRANSIYRTCVRANDQLAYEKFKGLVPKLEAEGEG